jgi:2-dehydropantoate 2-reductase
MNKNTNYPSPSDNLRVLVFGAGAIGTYVGGSMAIAGHTVVFLERPELLSELSKKGLRLDLGGRQEHVESPGLAGSIETALSFGPFDVAIFAMKSYDTKSALEELRIHSGQLPPVLCLQNGVDNEIVLETALGSTKVIAGTVTSAIGRRAIGDIVLERLRGMGVAGGHPLSNTLVRALDEAGLNAQIYPDASGMKWSKLVTNLLANATSAILDMSPGEIYAHPGLYHLELAQLREALAVMHALGVQAVNLPATPVRLLAFAVQQLPVWLSRRFLTRVVGGGRGSKMPSFYIDLHSGRGKSEVDYLNGAVVRYGTRLSVPTPANALLTETLMALTRGEMTPNTYAKQPEKLVAAYYSFTTP